MFTRASWISTLVLLICFAFPSLARAADVAVVYSIESSQSDGDTVQGTMTVTVFNLTSDDLKNVDLRLDIGGPNAIPRRVMQFGLVPADQGGVAQADFQFQQELFDEVDALPWRVNYDDMAGNHASIRIIAQRTH